MSTTTVDLPIMTPAQAAVEVHSIDYIPERERHGNVWNQATLWFLANAELATLAIGLIGISAGLSLFWAGVATLTGVVFGTLFQATHSVQGPRLGIPQMIQSRPQFGYYGAVWPQFVSVLEFIGFTVFNAIIGGQALAAATGLNSTVSLLVVFALALVFAIVGYDAIHFLARWGTYLFLVVFGFFTIAAAFAVHLPASQSGRGTFMLAPFLLTFGVAASYQVTGAVFVSDYSRYLKKSVTARSCFWWTFGGAGISALWMIVLGAFLSAAYPKGQTIDVVRLGGDAIFHGFGRFSLLVGVVGMVGAAAITLYSGALTTISVVDSIRKIRTSIRLRLAAIGLIAVVSIIFAVLVPANFLTAWSNFLLLIFYFLIPWSAVNLVDFFIIRRGQYAIREIFNPRGMYGRWGWRGLTAYFVTVAIMIPFFSTPIFTGPIANALSGADVSVLVGLPIAAILYYVLARGVDRTAELATVQRSNAELEKEFALAEVAGPERATN